MHQRQDSMRTTPAKYIELIATGVVVTLIVFVAFVARMRCANKQQLSMSEQPTHSSEVRTKAKGNEYVAVIETNALLSSISVDRVCGFDPTAASCYDLRNDALRSIARHRDLPADDVAALMVYVAATDCVMRVEREAALKNDVLNLLRSQKRQPEGLADLLLEMVASKQYAPVVVDYCIQHLGAMAEKISDDAMRARHFVARPAAHLAQPSVHSDAEDPDILPVLRVIESLRPFFSHVTSSRICSESYTFP